MRFIQETDEGVSPVVGVILMVAITVILAALIATFVLGLGGTVNKNPQAGVSFDQEPDNAPGADNDVNGVRVVVQVVSMDNADFVTVSSQSNSIGGPDTTDEDGDGVFDDLDSAGDIAYVEGMSSSLTDVKITITATLEGKTQVKQVYTPRDR